jgi:hypothetical protein
MAITRRQFITRTGLATAGTLLGPGLFGNPLVRRAFADLGDRYLVVIFLDGATTARTPSSRSTTGADRSGPTTRRTASAAAAGSA